jgi:hypothetical protein
MEGMRNRFIASTLSTALREGLGFNIKNLLRTNWPLFLMLFGLQSVILTNTLQNFPWLWGYYSEDPIAYISANRTGTIPKHKLQLAFHFCPSKPWRPGETCFPWINHSIYGFVGQTIIYGEIEVNLTRDNCPGYPPGYQPWAVRRWLGEWDRSQDP